MDRKIAVKGLFLYDETVVTAPVAGTFYGGFSSGDGVSAEEVCGELRCLNDLFSEPVMMISSPVSGIISYSPDGWENILTAERLGQLDLPALFEEYEPSAAAVSAFLYEGDPCFKVMENKKDLSVLLDLGTIAPDSESLCLRFEGRDVTAKVKSLRRYGDRCFALVQMAPTADCYRSRCANFEWVLERREGVVVDSAAITRRFGEVGVYCSVKGKLDFRPVTVVCSDGSRSLVQGISVGDCILSGKT